MLDDMTFQSRVWVFERIGWVVLAVLAVLAATGVFGHGPLANVVATVPGGGFSVEYSRFARVQSPTGLQVTVPPGPASDGSVRVWISADYLEDLTITEITPSPDSSELGFDSVAFVFLRSGGAPAKVRFTVEAESAGAVSGELGVESGPSIEVDQFFYP